MLKYNYLRNSCKIVVDCFLRCYQTEFCVKALIIYYYLIIIDHYYNYYYYWFWEV